MKLIDQMIEASEAATLPLNMNIWHCGTSCCIVGDLAAFMFANDDSLNCIASELASEIDYIFDRKGHGAELAKSIYVANASQRYQFAKKSGKFTEEELEHPHLNKDHSDRAIAIDFMKLIRRKISA